MILSVVSESGSQTISASQVVRSASYDKREVKLTSMHEPEDKQGMEETYFLQEYLNSSEWGVINVHKVSSRAQLYAVDVDREFLVQGTGLLNNSLKLVSSRRLGRSPPKSR